MNTLPSKEDFLNDRVSEPLAVRLAGLYDIWDKRDPDVDVFQFGLRSFEIQDADWVDMLGSSESFTRGVIRSGHQLLRYQRQMDADHVKRAFEFTWEGLKFCCYNGRGNSLTFESITDVSINAFMLIHFDGQRWTVSMYHTPWNKEIDLSVIAKKYGGGGHRGACGFNVLASTDSKKGDIFPFLPLL